MAAKPWIILPLVLPVGEGDDAKTYTITPVEYDVGLTLIASVEGTDDAKITDKSDDRELFKLVMGATWDQMVKDKQPLVVLFRAGISAVQYQMALLKDVDAATAVALAEKVWESGLDPEAVAAVIAAQIQARPKTSKRSTSTASASKTPPRASTRTTTSRGTIPRTAPTKTVPPRRGKPSPSSGR